MIELLHEIVEVSRGVRTWLLQTSLSSVASGALDVECDVGLAIHLSMPLNEPWASFDVERKTSRAGSSTDEVFQPSMRPDDQVKSSD